MENSSNSGTGRRSTCTKCFILTAVASFFLLGLSLLGTTIYIEVQWNHFSEINTDYFSKFVWAYICVGVTILGSGLIMLISSCFHKGRFIFSIVMLLMAMFSATAVTFCFVMKPWEKVPLFENEYRQTHQLDSKLSTRAINTLHRLEMEYVCCHNYAQDTTSTMCGPIGEERFWMLNNSYNCQELFHRVSLKRLPKDDILKACNTPCHKRLVTVYKTYFYSLLFQNVSAMVLQLIAFSYLISSTCSGCLRLLCPNRSPTRCRVSCDLLGNMCACGCTCIKAENTFDDNIPITPMESPPPYTDPVPEVVDDLIDLAFVEVHGEPRSSQRNVLQMVQTRL